jgi:ABC-type proline/glycine betaine transport system permease subunit
MSKPVRSRIKACTTCNAVSSTLCRVVQDETALQGAVKVGLLAIAADLAFDRLTRALQANGNSKASDQP